MSAHGKRKLYLARRYPLRGGGAVFVIFLLASCSETNGQTFWQGGVGSWFSPANWTGGVPSSLQAARINNGGTAQVGIPGAAAQSLLLGESTGHSGTLEVTGQAAFGNVHVAQHGTGTLNITGGGDVTSTRGDIAIPTFANRSPTGAVKVDGAGSTWTISGPLVAGDTGTATLEILNGGTVANTLSAIGIGAGPGPGTGIVTVDGAGSAWTCSDTLYVGSEATGIVNILNAATLSTATASVGAAASLNGAGGAGTLTVDGAGSAWTNSGELIVGDNVGGVGVLKIRNAGVVTVGNGLGVLTLAKRAGSQGTLRIGEGGAAGTISVGEITGGAGTAAVVFDHTDPGYLFSRPLTGTIGLQQIGSGKTSLTAAHSYTGATTVSKGTLELSGGGRLNNTSIVNVAPSAGQSASLRVTGAGSRITVAQSLHVGQAGSGAVVIDNGGSITAPAFDIGSLTPSTLTVDGPGSTLSIADLAIVGSINGGATVAVTGGGQVTTAGTIVSAPPQSNSILIDGPGSRWSTTGQFLVSIGFFLDGGPGLVTVSNGGVLSAAGGLQIGALGTVKGDGTIIGNVVNGGVFAPGKSPGTLNIQGNYQQQPTGSLELEIGGTASGLHDQLIVTGGNMSLEGQVTLKFVDGYLPRAGDQFDLLSVVGGLFNSAANFSFTGLAPGWQFSQVFDGDSSKLIVTSLNNAQPVPGTGADYNGDGNVNGADLAAWRIGFGAAAGATHAEGDADNDGDVEGRDFLFWQRQFGAGSGASSVPEPATLVAGVGAILVVSHRRKRIR